MSVMMKCGHAANCVMTRRDGIEYDPPLDACVICGCTDIAETPDLTGRQAKCFYRHMRGGQPHPVTAIVPSSPDLALFEHKPNSEFDKYYCGCWGWD